MSLADAVLEIARQWTWLTREDPRLPERVGEILTEPIPATQRARLVVRSVQPGLPDDSRVYAALDAVTPRAPEPVPLPQVLLPKTTKLEQDTADGFALKVLDDAMVTAGRPMARESTLQAIVPTGVDLAVHVSAWADPDLARLPRTRTVLFLDPVQAFLRLPVALQTPALATCAVQGARLVPAFQYEMRQHLRLRTVVAETHEILDPARDPWGCASWWTRPNGWLGCPPVDLLGTEREAEIVAAAQSLTSDSW